MKEGLIVIKRRKEANYEGRTTFGKDATGAVFPRRINCCLSPIIQFVDRLLILAPRKFPPGTARSYIGGEGPGVHVNARSDMGRTTRGGNPNVANKARDATATDGSRFSHMHAVEMLASCSAQPA